MNYGSLLKHRKIGFIGAGNMGQNRDRRAHTLVLMSMHIYLVEGLGDTDKLKGEQIPLLVRLLSVADVYDALRSDRPYRPGLPHDECLKILCKNADEGGLDYDLVRYFCDIEFTRPEMPNLAALLAMREQSHIVG